MYTYIYIYICIYIYHMYKSYVFSFRVFAINFLGKTNTTAPRNMLGSRLQHHLKQVEPICSKQLIWQIPMNSIFVD